MWGLGLKRHQRVRAKWLDGKWILATVLGGVGPWPLSLLRYNLKPDIVGGGWLQIRARWRWQIRLTRGYTVPLSVSMMGPGEL